MGLLSALDLGLVLAGLGRHVILAVFLGDIGAGLLLGGGGHVDRIGAHIGDEAHRALLAQLDSLIELLGHDHGPSSAKMELVGCRPLHGAGDEGWSRMTPLLPPFHLGHHIGGALKLLDDPLGLLLALEVHLLTADAV